MTKKQNDIPTGKDAPAKDEQSLDALNERIVTLAHKRSETLLVTDPDDAAFDRGARALRLLMGAAEVSSRLKRAKQKEQEADDAAAGQKPITEEDIEQSWRDVEALVDRLAADEAALRAGDHDALPDGATGADVEAKRS